MEPGLHRELVALSFQVSSRATLDVVGCVFRGHARRAVLAAGGAVKLLGCRFGIEAIPDPQSFGTADVELTCAFGGSSRFASLEATACVSSSPSFLSASEPATTNLQDYLAAPPKASQALLVAVTHDANRARGGDGFHGPAVAWKTALFGASSPTDGAWLFLNGCTFVSSAEPTGEMPLPRVFVDAGLGRAFDAATFHPSFHGDAFGTRLPRTPEFARSLGRNGSDTGPTPTPFPTLLTRVVEARAAGLLADQELLRAWTRWLPRA